MDELLRIIREAKEMIKEERERLAGISESLPKEALHPATKPQGWWFNIDNKLPSAAENG